MTFSTKVKQEIISSNVSDGNELSMLCGIILTAGSIVISNKQMSFTLTSENYQLLNYSKKLIRKMYPQSVIDFPENKPENKQRVVLALDGETANTILFDCGIFNRDNLGRINISLIGDSHLVIERDAKLAYIAGCFLGGGTISVPVDEDVFSNINKPSGYHLEWTFTSSNQAQLICEILATFDIFAKMVERAEKYVVYIKESETISNVIGLLGATNSYLWLENQMVSRQMRNLVNRQSNCISANIDKTVVAGLKQLEAIKQIESTIGLQDLPQSLREIAQTRKENPEASLSDIVELLGGKISKSAVNARLRNLVKIADNLGEDKW